MKVAHRLLYFLCFVGLAAASALALSRIATPSIAPLLLRAVVAASLAGLPGLLHRKAWPATLVLLPLGAYLLLRTIVPVPVDVHGWAGQYHFYVQTLWRGAGTYTSQVFPLSVEGAPELKLVLALAAYSMAGIAAFFALGLRKALPAVVVLLVVVGFSLTVDDVTRVIWVPVLFVVLSACVLVTSRALKRTGGRITDILIGGAVGLLATVLAFTLLSATSVAASKPWQDWRTWGLPESSSVYVFNWLQNYPRLLDPANNVVVMRVKSPIPTYWRANALDTFTGSAWLATQPFVNELDAEGSNGSYTYTMPGRQPRTTGQTITETFHITSVFTNYFFTGGNARVLTLGNESNVRTNDVGALHASAALGPEFDYTLSAFVPLVTPKSLVGLGRNYPASVQRYLQLPFQHLGDLRSANPAAEWQATYGRGRGQPGQEGVARPVRVEQEHHRHGHRSVRHHPPHRRVPAQVLHVQPHSALQRVPFALCGVPVRHPHRLLPALRRGHGSAPALQRDPRSSGRWFRDRRAQIVSSGTGLHLHCQHEQCARLGGGLLP